MKKKKQTYSTKLFLISFLVAAIILTFLFGLFHRFMLNKEVTVDNLLSGVTVPEYSAEDSVNFLVVYDSDLSGSDLFAAAVCCNAATKIISVCEIDLRLETLSNQERASLSDQYHLRGMKGLRAGVESLLQSEFDAMIRCDRNGLTKIAETVGHILLQQDDLNGLTQPASANAYYFAEQFDSPEQRAILFYRLTESCFKNNDTAEDIKLTVFRECDTDLSAYQALLHRNAIEYLISKQSFSLLPLTVQKIELGNNIVYIPNPDELSVLQKAMN